MQIGKVFFHYLKKSKHAHIVVYAGLGSHIFKKKTFFQKYEYAKYLLISKQLTPLTLPGLFFNGDNDVYILFIYTENRS